MTEQTDAAEVEGPYAGRSMAEIIDDYVLVRGDLYEQYARTQLLRIIAAREAAARAEALREAADAWTQGAWSDVMLPKPTPPAVPVIAYSNRMGDWLRDRADSIARTDGAGS